jgi:hypothetical protein
VGMDKCHITDYQELVNQFQKIGLEKFASKYMKYDALIGESRAIEFIESKIKLMLELKYKSN